MGSILSGIVLHGPTRAYGGTFLQFSDYMRPAVRLASLMGIDTIYIWTHDSIGLGEDGPTHQPVEHLAALRAIPGLNVVRPADANETVIAWREILKRYTKVFGKGSGMGLAQIYGFARQSNGHLKLYSEVGHGTTVRLYLPRATTDGRPPHGATDTTKIETG